MVLVLLSWGVLTFGAVYAWAHRPLALAAVVVGVLGLEGGRRNLGANASLFVSLASLAVFYALQLVPLPEDRLFMISPATDRFLRWYDFNYAVGIIGTPDGDPTRIATSHALSIAPAATLQGLGLLGALTILLAGMLRTLSRDAVVMLARGIVWLGAAVALTGIVQKLTLGDDAYGGMKIYGFWAPLNRLTTPFGPFVNKNHFAGWMAMALPIAYGLILGTIESQQSTAGPGLRRRLVWLSSRAAGSAMLTTWAALLMTLSLVMTRSRSGLMCLVAVIALVMLVARARLAWRGRRVALVVALVLVAISPVVWAGEDTALARLTQGGESIAIRRQIWEVSLAIFRDFPIFGTGLDTFGVATLPYQPAGSLHYQEAHNEYLQILVEGGIIGAVLATLAAIGAGLAIHRRFAQDEDRAGNYWIRIGATVGLCAIALQSVVDFSLQMPGNAVLFTVLLALALHSPARLRRSGSASLDPARPQ